jgi:hypothetical protein
VRFVRSDGGGEFGSLEAQAELNGVIERFMRTAKEMITAMWTRTEPPIVRRPHQRARC